MKKTDSFSVWPSTVKHPSVYTGRGRFLLRSFVKSLGMAQTGFLVPIKGLREDVTEFYASGPARWTAVKAPNEQA